ncbi:carbohydrate sulfotransferase 9-like [Mya arenaria]|uniref:carbohydrate sulfotransferase 9-like n=1 Tax=Mya arenaria TaxID=6604 RepID=UPI0022E233E3|nr:carbohydrate sulfotransferase 9-like [Mya arenaria]
MDMRQSVFRRRRITIVLGTSLLVVAMFVFGTMERFPDVDIQVFIMKQRAKAELLKNTSVAYSKYLRNQPAIIHVNEEEKETKLSDASRDNPLQTTEDVNNAKSEEDKSRNILKIAAKKSPADPVLQRFLERKADVQRVCDNRPELQEITFPYTCGEEPRKAFLKQDTMPLMYCAIEKTGSTFWRRILQVAGGASSGRPSLIRTMNAYNENGYHNMLNTPYKNIEANFKTMTSIMFVRSPYQRLFSGWLDKMYSPNWIFWIVLGDEVVKTQRKVDHFKKHTCGYDITFSEFIAHTVEDLIKKNCVNSHFTPSFYHCFPCIYDMDYIGKYETFKEDTVYLTKKLNMSVVLDKFDHDATTDAITDAVDFVYNERVDIVKCNVSFRCALFKVWQRLKARGIIGLDCEFPYKTDSEANKAPYGDFYHRIVKANADSDKGELKLNRKKAYVQAIRSLSDDLISKLAESFEVDFTMFGYDTDPLGSLSDIDTSGVDFFPQCP